MNSRSRQLVTFNVPRPMHEAIRRVANDEGLPVSAFLRILVAAAIERNGQGKPIISVNAA